MQTLLVTLLASTLLAAPASPPMWVEVGVPFACGLTFPVSQAHHVGSHAYNDVWAWDFRMPAGTPVVAAMDGTVRMARGDSDTGGCDPRFAPFANYVVITHTNGLETQYLHFREVTVRAGQKVRAGEVLGYSGDTGWACGAHLHFKLAKTQSNGWNNPSVRALIKGYGDPQLDAVVTAPACAPEGVRMAARDNAAEPAVVPPAVSSTADAPTSHVGGSSSPRAPKVSLPARASKGPL